MKMAKLCQKEHEYLDEVDELFIDLLWTKGTEPMMIQAIKPTA